MTPELKETIKAMVLADQAPDILREIIATCDAEGERLRDIAFANYKSEPEPRSPAAWALRDKERKTDLWVWWQMFAGRDLLWVVEHMDQAIRERDWTNAQKDERRKDEEIAKAERELARAKA